MCPRMQVRKEVDVKTIEAEDLRQELEELKKGDSNGAHVDPAVADQVVLFTSNLLGTSPYLVILLQV